MSHGGSDEKPAEPNLVPLLDLVLQLIMFFMIVSNFVVEQLDQSIVLPTAATAKSLDRTESNLLFINVDETGRLLPVDAEPMLDPRQIENYMRRKFNDHLRVVDGKKEEAEKMLVIVRAHESAKFEVVFRVLKAVKQAGFKRLQLRAKIA
jgi:biopolymer transport protein ExbD